MMRLKIILGVSVLVALAGGCSSNSGSGEEVASGAPSIVPSPTATKPPKLPLSESRLAGKYQVKLYVTSNSFDSKPLQAQLFRFLPKCDEGACDVTITGAMAFGQGLEDRQSAGADKRFDIRLVNLGRGYQGTKVGYWASCGDEPDKDRWTFAIKVDKARYVGDAWTVVRWSGTWTRRADFGNVCLPGHLRAVIRGTRATG
jgi:hypothetical protein